MFSPRMNNFLFNLAAIFRVTAFDEMTKGKKKKIHGILPKAGSHGELLSETGYTTHFLNPS